jgi:hypothetical protein
LMQMASSFTSLALPPILGPNLSPKVAPLLKGSVSETKVADAVNLAVLQKPD